MSSSQKPIFDAVALSQKLIQQKSVSGEKDQGALDILETALKALSFDCDRLVFDGDGSYEVDNLFAKLSGGNSGDGKNLCFAGHTDVVPAGDEAAWSSDPYAAEIEDGVLIGRGAVDMKAAIAAWVAAISKYLASNELKNGSLSLIITGDEEADSVNGTKKMLGWMEKNNEKIDACIVGEPTNPESLGEMIKIGRRGSITFYLEVHGMQGHVAYPDIAINPIPPMVKILSSLTEHKLDDGSEFFLPSNLEITTIDVGNSTTNLIPSTVKATFNIRFNDRHTAYSLEKWVIGRCEEVTGQFSLRTDVSSESFITEPGQLSNIVGNAVYKAVGKQPELSTTGGTSDARFIKDLCPVVECGLINKTAHKVDEKISVDDINDLTEIYFNIIESYFSN